MDEAVEERWGGWGTPDRAVGLPPAVAGLLGSALGVRDGTAAGTPPDVPGAVTPPDVPRAVTLADVQVDPPALPATARAALEAVTTLDDGHDARARHSGGKSTPDLLRQRAGEVTGAPDAIAYPAAHDEVVAVLRTCAEHGVQVVPFGGGTSVVGGLAPPRTGPRISLDLRRLTGLLDLDPVSRTATIAAGTRAPAADEALAAHGFTLGHVPQSYEYATIGGFAATRSSGQASAGYGRFDDMVVALRVATPRGTIDTGRAPASSAGPDLRQLFLGSEGTLGVITAVTVRIRPLPETRHYEGWRFDSFAAGLVAVRRLAQDGPRPTVLRLSDEMETAVTQRDGSLLIAGFEGSSRTVSATRDGAAEVLRDAGGTPRGPGPGDEWVAGRFAGPYLRDALLDAGAFAETLETAAFWSRLPDLYESVRGALIDTLGEALVLCHVSHVYETGASLYFTVVRATGPDPLTTWYRAKSAAGEAILAAGGTITHHHGVGTDHRDFYVREIGPLAVETLHAVKTVLDPQHILNPGILLP